MENIKKGKLKIIVLILIILVLLFWILLKNRQQKLNYKVSGQELLEIKEKCKNLAKLKVIEFNKKFNLHSYDLVGYGYSEFRGSCYAEFIQTWSDLESKMLYDTTEEKHLSQREWPDDIRW